MRSQSIAGTAVGVLAFLVGLVGYVVFGWRFDDGASNPLGFGLALVAVAVAVALTVRDRL